VRVDQRGDRDADAAVARVVRDDQRGFATVTRFARVQGDRFAAPRLAAHGFEELFERDLHAGVDLVERAARHRHDALEQAHSPLQPGFVREVDQEVDQALQLLVFRPSGVSAALDRLEAAGDGGLQVLAELGGRRVERELEVDEGEPEVIPAALQHLLEALGFRFVRRLVAGHVGEGGDRVVFAGGGGDFAASRLDSGVAHGDGVAGGEGGDDLLEDFVHGRSPECDRERGSRVKVGTLTSHPFGILADRITQGPRALVAFGP
jgi:hypothetical protein